MENTVIFGVLNVIMFNKESVFPNGDFLQRVSQKSITRAKELFDGSLIENHVNEGFLCLSALEYDLSCISVPDLKAFLSAHTLKVSGKKADLIPRIIENIPIDDIRTLASDSYYLLTPKGQEAVERWRESLRQVEQRERAEHQQKRIETMKMCASFIASQDFYAVVSLMHYENSGQAVYPEAIYLGLQDLNLLDYKHILAAVDYLILSSDQRMIIDDMACLGYIINEETLCQIIAGTRSYVDLLHIRIWTVKYQVRSRSGKNHCDHCQSFDGKIFSVNEAKMGVTLPPFCKSCNCYITGISE